MPIVTGWQQIQQGFLLEAKLMNLIKGRRYRKFDRLEILSRRSYFLGNFIAECYFFLGNIIAARKFDRSQHYGSERLLWSMTYS